MCQSWITVKQYDDGTYRAVFIRARTRKSVRAAAKRAGAVSGYLGGTQAIALAPRVYP